MSNRTLSDAQFECRRVYQLLGSFDVRQGKFAKNARSQQCTRTDIVSRVKRINVDVRLEARVSIDREGPIDLVVICLCY